MANENRSSNDSNEDSHRPNGETGTERPGPQSEGGKSETTGPLPADSDVIIKGG